MKKGGEMVVVIMVFTTCVLAMFAAIWVYNKSEDTAFHETKDKITVLESQLTDLRLKLKSSEDLLSSNINTVASTNLKIKDMEEKVLVCTSLFQSNTKKTSESVEMLQEHCAKLREGQVTLQERLSAKDQKINIDLNLSKPALKKALPLKKKLKKSS